MLANFAALVKKGKKNEENFDESDQKQPVGKKEKSKQPEPVVGGKKADKEIPKKVEKEVFSDEDDDKKKKGKKKGKAGKGGKEKEKEEETKEKDKKEGGKKEKDVKNKEKNTKKNKKQKKEEDEDEEPEDEEEKKEEEENEEEGEKEVKGSGEPTIPVKIMDEYIYEAFMNAIRMSITEKDLPMDSSVFYASHMLLCKKENILIDLKNSSYKKVAKYDFFIHNIFF